MVNMLKVLVAVVILIFIIGLAMLGKRLMRVFRFKTAKTPHKESLWIEAITTLLVIIISIANYSRNRPDATIVMWIGTFVFLFGGFIQLLAKKQLHNNITFEERLTEGFSAAQTGLYAKIRHPSKTALLALLAGLCLSLGSWWGLGLLFILCFPSILYRIKQEERALLDKFGERWLAYKSDTKKIIPGIL